ncbi:MAG: accessory gene regulator B family protein [Bacillota bacterium]|nr:accessory gene regulator B family protein [Bacillota bacterium]
MAKRFTAAIVRYISAQCPEKSKEELEIIGYGLEGVLTTVPKIAFIITVGYFLNILQPLLCAVLSFGILRTFASGVHSNNGWACLIFSSIVFLFIAYAGVYIPLPMLLKIFMFLVSFILLTLYAPADTEERPLVVPRIRQELKVSSLIFTGLMFIIMLLLPSGHVIGNIITYSVIIESVMTTPAIYFILNRRYRNYEYYET